MRDRIRDKLGGVLKDGATSEALVVYFLVEVRKLMDREGIPFAEYPSLRMYSNWAVHVELANSQAQELVKTADSFYLKLIAGEPTAEDKEQFRGLFNFETFRAELTQYLRVNRLPDFDDRWWNAFLTHFLNVVEDCPLICKARAERVEERVFPAQEPMRSVDEVVIYFASKPEAVAAGAPPPINWALCCQGSLVFPISATSALSDDFVDALVQFGKLRDRKRKALATLLGSS